ncbi:hypothetical protein HERIO_712 [Hepatospora eriocheir]|uniref:Uncharacterized protein n=1 Tax=Hepatospora eriocheir TaxID=1081669 RepID=A0A1X0QCC0_9MICR|nr:hypothetical protein HERIO_712 [Hepatospora eriocheir]
MLEKIKNLSYSNLITCEEFNLVFSQLPNILKTEKKFTNDNLNNAMSVHSYFSLIAMIPLYLLIKQFSKAQVRFIITGVPLVCTLLVYFSKENSLMAGGVIYALVSLFDNSKNVISKLGVGNGSFDYQNYIFKDLIKKLLSSCVGWISQELFDITKEFSINYCYTLLVTSVCSIIVFIQLFGDIKQPKFSLNNLWDTLKKSHKTIDNKQKLILLLSTINSAIYTDCQFIYYELLLELKDAKNSKNQSFKIIEVIYLGIKKIINIICLILIFPFQLIFNNIGEKYSKKVNLTNKNNNDNKSNNMSNTGYFLGLVKILSILFIYLLSFKFLESSFELIFLSYCSLLIISIIIIINTSNKNIIDSGYFFMNMSSMGSSELSLYFLKEYSIDQKKVTT